MPSVNLFEKVPGADLELISTCSDRKSIMVHSYLLWTYSPVVAKMIDDAKAAGRTCKTVDVGETIEDVTELMNVLYNHNFKMSGKMDLHRDEYDIIPMRLYSMVNDFEISKLMDPSFYEADAGTDIGDWKDVKNIDATAMKAVDWLLKTSRFCTVLPLKVAYIKKMAKIIAMCTVVSRGDLVHPEATEIPIASKMLNLAIPILKMIGESQKECVIELRRTGKERMICLSWWYMFLRYHMHETNISSDDLKSITQSASYCMIKAYTAIGCSIGIISKNGEEKRLSISDIIEHTTIREAISHDLKVGSLVCYTIGIVMPKYDSLAITFLTSRNNGEYMTERFTARESSEIDGIVKYSALCSEF